MGILCKQTNISCEEAQCIINGTCVVQNNIPIQSESEDDWFLAILEENYQAQIAGFYNYDKTNEERKIRQAVITEYQDLISIYKTKLITRRGTK